MHDPVDAVGKQEFGIEVGYTLKMSYIDPEPPMGMKQNKLFKKKKNVYYADNKSRCLMQVEEFVIERPCRERGVVIGGPVGAKL